MKKTSSRPTCPTCGRGRLSHRLVDRTIRVRGGTLTVQGLFVEACDACDEEIITAGELRRAQDIARCLMAERRAAG